MDELNHVPDDVPMEGMDTYAQNNAQKDLAFVGYTFKRYQTFKDDL